MANNHLLNKGQWAYIRNLYQITDREFQIAQLICQGANNKEIAHALDIQEGTVKTHIKNIYSKTRAHSKVDLFLKILNDARQLAE